jgi:hypothetical protein
MDDRDKSLDLASNDSNDLDFDKFIKNRDDRARKKK